MLIHPYTDEQREKIIKRARELYEYEEIIEFLRTSTQTHTLMWIFDNFQITRERGHFIQPRPEFIENILQERLYLTALRHDYGHWVDENKDREPLWEDFHSRFKKDYIANGVAFSKWMTAYLTQDFEEGQNEGSE